MFERKAFLRASLWTFFFFNVAFFGNNFKIVIDYNFLLVLRIKVTETQLKLFLKEVFQSLNTDNYNDNKFVTMNLTTEQIYRIIHKYTDYFKTTNSFTSFCGLVHLNFLNVEAERVELAAEGRKERSPVRCLRVLKSNFQGKERKKEEIAYLMSFYYFRYSCYQN